MSKNMNMPAAALAVYLPEQWSRWLDTAEDASNLEDTWEEWYEILLKAKIDLTRQGIRFVEVTIDFDEFEKYRLAHNLKNNSGERAGYAATLLSEQRQKTSRPKNHKKRTKKRR